MKRIIHIFFPLFLICLIPTQDIFGQSLKAIVRKSNISQNERFQLTFQLENVDAKSIEYPKFSGFQKIFGPQLSQQASYQNINGKLTQSVTVNYTFVLVPQKTGTYSIGSAVVTDQKGKKYKSDPVKLTVSAAPAAQQGANKNASVNRQQAIEAELKQMIFLRAYVSKKKLYQGDQFVVTYKLFHAPEIVGRLNNLELEEAPGYQGFWAEKVELKNSQPTLEVLNGRRFYVSVLKQDILIPQKAGKLKIDPLTVSMQVPIAKPRKRKRDPFDPFADLDDLFQSPFGRHENYKFLTRNSAINIDVTALPGAKPNSFNGLVGKLNLDVKLNQDSVEAGEAITLSVKYSGEGNIPKIQAPDLKFPTDFEVYDPKIKERVSRNGGKLNGYKTFEYLIIPRIPGEYEIPKIEVSYFDPKAAKYKTISKDRLALTVSGDPSLISSAKGSGVNKEDVALLGEDIRHIRSSSGTFIQKDAAFLGSGTYWSLLIAPLFLFFGLLFYKKKLDSEKADVKGSRSRKASKLAKKRLATAQKYIKESDERGFFNEVSQVLWSYLSDKLALGQSDLSRDQISELLLEKGVEASRVEEIKTLMDHCEFALFAPSKAEVGLQGTYDEALNMIVKLEKELNG